MFLDIANALTGDAIMDKSQIVKIISDIVCARCRKHSVVSSEQCKKHGCFKLYEQEAEAILQAIDAEKQVKDNT